MNKDCSRLVEIIEGLIADIDRAKQFWLEMRVLNPDFEQVSEESWLKKEAFFWIHWETKAHKAIALEQWLHVKPPISKTSKSLAFKHYLKWQKRKKSGTMCTVLRDKKIPTSWRSLVSIKG